MIEGIRVVELSTDVAGAFLGRLLAAYGADVIVVEPPGGHLIRSLPPHKGDGPDASVLAAYLHAGKRSATLDLRDGADRALVARLVRSADAVIDSHAPGALAALGLDLDALVEERPATVVCAITPYGQTGPRAGWRATSLTAAATGGQMSMAGDPDKPPLKTAGHQAYYQAALHAFGAITAGLYTARVTGLGDVIDISIQEVQVATLEGAGPGALTRGGDGFRTGNLTFAQWGIHQSADGWVGVAAMPRQTGAIYDCIGHPEFKADPTVANGWSPGGNELLGALLPPWIAERTSQQIFAEAAKVRAPFSLIPTPRELLEWPALAETEFWRWVEHPVLGRHPLPGGPIEFNGSDRGDQRRAPLAGEHSAEVRAELDAGAAPAWAAGVSAASGEAALPYAGIRVIDATQIWAGPYGTRLMADMGADVIKVEGPAFPDGIRTMAGATQAPAINQSAYFNEYNRNKRGIALDIQKPAGMEALLRLLGEADVFVENWSSGVADRLGLTFEALHALNPRLIVISMPGFGHRGGDSARVGFGPSIEQMGGLVALQGYESGPPHRSGISYGDPMAGVTGSAALGVALIARERTGEGSDALVAQRDVIIGLIGEYVVAEALGVPLPTQIGSHDALWAPHNVYQAADGATRPVFGPLGDVLRELTDRWLTIAIDSDDAWRALRDAIGGPRLADPAYATLAGRRASEAEIDSVIGEWVRTQDADAAAARLQAAGVAAAPVLTPLLVTTDEHLLARSAFLALDHPDAGHIRTTRPTWRFRRRPITSVRPAPQFAQHTAEVLTTLGGYSEAEVAAFLEAGVVAEDLVPA
ncbi:MAG: CoA transferase [Chloroflexi bacterium]|nr:CoA transferase [Chloroflexota bacterium]MQC27811.1 CoA transferase [Chloroflexota bacterium]